MAYVVLQKSGWLRRTLHVKIDGAHHIVEYSGHGFGYEEVLVDGRLACRQRSWFWYAPRFDFQLAGRAAWLEVQVSPWLCISSFRLGVGDQVVYAEGQAKEDAEPSAPADRPGEDRFSWL
jgi:hypothetical protein